MNFIIKDNNLMSSLKKNLYNKFKRSSFHNMVYLTFYSNKKFRKVEFIQQYLL